MERKPCILNLHIYANLINYFRCNTQELKVNKKTEEGQCFVFFLSKYSQGQ